MPPERPLLTVREAARLAGISRAVAYSMAAEGSLPGLVSLPGHRRLVRRRVLEAWLNGELEAGDQPAPAQLRAVR